jgi:hypothetical protein
MTEPNPQDDKSNTDQKSAESTLGQRVGELATDNSTNATDAPKAEKHVASQPIKSLAIKPWRSAAGFWESLKGRGVSNRLIAIDFIFPE